MLLRLFIGKNLLFLLFLPTVFAQGIDFDQLRTEVSNAENSKAKAAAMVRIGSAFPPPQAELTLSYADSILLLENEGEDSFLRSSSDYLKALGYYRKSQLDAAKKLFKEIADESYRLQSLNYLGIIYLRLNQADSALLVFDELLKLAPENDLQATVKAYGNRGKAHKQLGDYASAINDFETCVAMDSANQFSILNSYLSIAGIFTDMEMHEKSIQTLRKVDIEAIPPQPIKAAYFNNLGQSFVALDFPDSAIKYLQKGYETAMQVKQYPLTLKNRLQIAKIRIEQSRLEEARSTIDAVKEDLHHYPIPPVRIDYHLTNADYFYAAGLYDSAISEAAAILLLTKNGSTQFQKQDIYQLLGDTYSKMGNSEVSNRYYKMHAAYTDSLMEARNDKFKRDAIARYKLAEKNKQLAAGEEESTMLKRWQLVLVVSMIFLLGIAILLSRRLKKSKISYQDQVTENEVLAEEIERNRSEIIELKSRAVLQVNEIVSIKADGHYLEFKLSSKEKPEIDRNGIKAILTNLPTKFIQIHRSYIVNVEFIKVKYADKVILNDGSELPVSRTYRKALDGLLAKK